MNYFTVLKALLYATYKHRGQKRKGSGKPYITHPIAVAKIVYRSTISTTESVTAALLHDVVEDTDTTTLDIYHMFGSEVATIVDRLTDPEMKGTRKTRKDASRERIANSGDIVQTIKLADMLHNLSDVNALPPKFAKLYKAEKTEALRDFTLGDYQLKEEVRKILVDT